MLGDLAEQGRLVDTQIVRRRLTMPVIAAEGRQDRSLLDVLQRSQLTGKLDGRVRSRGPQGLG